MEWGEVVIIGAVSVLFGAFEFLGDEYPDDEAGKINGGIVVAGAVALLIHFGV